MKIAFHGEQLGCRGTETAIYDYAHFNEFLLKNESFIFSPSYNDLSGLNRFKSRFESKVFLYDKDISELQYVVDNNKIEVVYFIKAGFNDGKKLNNTKNVVHSVFRYNDEHSDKYAYVSKWLSDEMSGGTLPYVPHIISLPEVNSNYREFLNIPKEATVFGRHGGNLEFNIPWVYPVIEKVAKENPDKYFLFMNTDKFCEELPNIIHLEPTYDLEEKTAFINTCDCMIHARERGESFGLAIGEFLHQNKPVVACTGGEDKNHLRLLKDKGIYYTNQNELYYHLMDFKKHTGDERYKDLVRKYNPEDTMKKFKEVFLS